MCGRYVSVSSAGEVAHVFDAAPTPAAAEVPPRVNVAPTSTVLAVEIDADGRRGVEAVRWGLVPPWYKDLAKKPQPINARADKLDGGFYKAAMGRRLLIPADAYLEWTTTPDGKQPWVHEPDDAIPMLAFAGISTWRADLGCATAAIVTTDAAGTPSRVHDRMPVMLTPEEWTVWLDPDLDRSDAAAMCMDRPAPPLRIRPVSPVINRVGPQDPALLDTVRVPGPVDVRV